MPDTYVLLVEDNPDDVALTELAFKKANVIEKLVVASNGQKALDFLFSQDGFRGRDISQKPSLILLDLKLPLVSGLDVLKEVKANEDTNEITVVVLTSSAEDKDRSESYRLGANDYISKPTGFNEFIEIVKQIKAKWLDSNANSPMNH
jgi:two-component system response regulator